MRIGRAPTYAQRASSAGFKSLRVGIRYEDLEPIALAKAAAKACGVSDADLLRAAYADALRKYRAILESDGKWESVLAEHIEARNARSKGTQRAPKANTNPPQTAPNPRPPQIFEG
jgi:hypothetical protein